MGSLARLFWLFTICPCTKQGCASEGALQVFLPLKSGSWEDCSMREGVCGQVGVLAAMEVGDQEMQVGTVESR